MECLSVGHPVTRDRSDKGIRVFLSHRISYNFHKAFSRNYLSSVFALDNFRNVVGHIGFQFEAFQIWNYQFRYFLGNDFGALEIRRLSCPEFLHINRARFIVDRSSDVWHLELSEIPFSVSNTGRRDGPHYSERIHI